MSMTPPQPTGPKPPARQFASVETWVFDLDNTLYPHDLNLWQQIDDRIRAFVSDFLRVTKDEAFRVQKDYYRRYGTTMRGLMAEHDLKPDTYLEFVHQIDHSPLLPNPDLGAAIELAAGLAPSDRIIDNPPENIATGDLVKVANPAAPSAKAAHAAG